MTKKLSENKKRRKKFGRDKAKTGYVCSAIQLVQDVKKSRKMNKFTKLSYVREGNLRRLEKMLVYKQIFYSLLIDEFSGGVSCYIDFFFIAKTESVDEWKYNVLQSGEGTWVL